MPLKRGCKCEIKIGATGHLRAADEDVVDGNVDELDDVADDTWHMSVMVSLRFGSTTYP